MLHRPTTKGTTLQVPWECSPHPETYFKKKNKHILHIWPVILNSSAFYEPSLSLVCEPYILWIAVFFFFF